MHGWRVIKCMMFWGYTVNMQFSVNREIRPVKKKHITAETDGTGLLTTGFGPVQW